MTIEDSENYIKRIETYIKQRNDTLNSLNKKIKYNNELIEKNKTLKKKDKNKLKKDKINQMKKENILSLKQIKQINKEVINLSKSIEKEKKNIEKKLKPKTELDFIWRITTFIFGIGFLMLLIIMSVFKTGALVWMGSSFLLLLMFLCLFIFLIFLAKKTHAILEFKALMSGKPLCLFFTDHKRVDWRVIEPTAGVITDKNYGAFLVNEKGSYVDMKTRNVLLPFNPSVGTNAPLEAYKLSGGLGKVFKDEKYLSRIRYALAKGEYDGENITIFNDEGRKEQIKDFPMLRESVDFSYLKSMLNTILPHNINSKIEMQVAQRVGAFGKINGMQIVLIIVAILGATALAAMLLSMFGNDGGTTTIVKEVATQAVVNNSTTNSIGG